MATIYKKKKREQINTTCPQKTQQGKNYYGVTIID